MQQLGNGVIGLSVFADAKFDNWYDWIRYIIHIAQMVLDAYVAIVICGITIKVMPNPHEALVKVLGIEQVLTYVPQSFGQTVSAKKSLSLIDGVKILALVLDFGGIFTSFLGGYYYFFTMNIAGFIAGTSFFVLSFFV